VEGKASARPAAEERIVSANGLLVMPGGIDPHTHMVTRPHDARGSRASHAVR
jgi:imidazolonepropionase-like amidohydrolase